MRDSKKNAFYRAERRVEDLRGDELTPAEVVAFVRKIEASSVWLKLPAVLGFGATSSRTVRWRNRTTEVTVLVPSDGRYRRRSWARGDTRILIQQCHRHRWVIVHEMAHIAVSGILKSTAAHPRVDYASHGWQFCKVYLRLVRRFFGADAERALKAELKKERISYSKPKTMTPERLGQLREQGRKLAATKSGRLGRPKGDWT